MQLQNKCLFCEKELEGRSDKKYCDIHCKSSYQYQQHKLNKSSFYNKINLQLKLNRRILKYYNKDGKTTVRRPLLKEKGFDSNYFTHFWKNSRGHVYLFVYEYGFLKTSENGKQKYVLVKWQPYMSNNH